MRYFYRLALIAVFFISCLSATAQDDDLPNYSSLSQAELKAKADAGDSHAMFSYGYNLLFGEDDSDGVTLIDNPDFETAIPLITAAHEAGHPNAHTILVTYYRGIMGPEPQNDQLEAIIISAVKNPGNDLAKFNYGTHFLQDSNPEVSQQAFSYLIDVLDTDYLFSDAYVMIVETLYQGSSGIKADYPKARQEAINCVRALPEESYCAYILGRDYQQGWGGSANDELAIKYFLLAAENGEPRAQWQTGMYYLNGLGGLEKSEKKAYDWVKSAAEQDYLEGLISYGVMNAIGQGTEINYDASFEAYEKATRMGSAHALRSIGFMYYLGQGQSVDKEMGLAALLLAYEKGDENAGELLFRFYDISTQDKRDEARFLVSGEIETLKSRYD